MSLLKKCFIVLIALIFVQCGKENQFLIEKGNVGYLNKLTTIKELNSIFKKDSISSNITDNILKDKLFTIDTEEYIVFSKEGKKLLEIAKEFGAVKGFVKPIHLRELEMAIEELI
mgnify:CR=1 FL=1